VTINSKYCGSSTTKIRSVKMVSSIMVGLVFLDETIMSSGQTEVFTRMSKSRTSSRNNKTARCRLAGGGLLVSTKYPLAFNAHGFVESGLGLLDDTAIVILALPLSFLFQIVHVNEPTRDKSGLLELYEFPSIGPSKSVLRAPTVRHSHDLFTLSSKRINFASKKFESNFI
jgi:hypothetical protein